VSVTVTTSSAPCDHPAPRPIDRSEQRHLVEQGAVQLGTHPVDGPELGQQGRLVAARHRSPAAAIGDRCGTEILERVEDRRQRRHERVLVEHGRPGGVTQRGAPVGIVEQVAQRLVEVLGGDEVDPVDERLEPGRRLGDHGAPVGHRLDHARPLEVAGLHLVAMDVQQDPAAAEQLVLVAPEHHTGHVAVDRAAEPEQPQLGAPVPEQRCEARQHCGTPWRAPAEEQHLDVAVGVGAAVRHRRHATEAQVGRCDVAGGEPVDAVAVDVEDRRRSAHELAREVEPRGARLLGAHRHAHRDRTPHLVVGGVGEREVLVRRDHEVEPAVVGGESVLLEPGLRPDWCAASTIHAAMSVMNALPPAAANTVTGLMSPGDARWRDATLHRAPGRAWRPHGGRSRACRVHAGGHRRATAAPPAGSPRRAPGP
jgi:hypothetical protein